jgi:hypothetical protein
MGYIYFALDRYGNRRCTVSFINVGRLKDRMLMAYKRAIYIYENGGLLLQKMAFATPVLWSIS